MVGDDEIKGWRDYRRLEPIAQLNSLLRRSDDSGWIATRELLAQMGWTDFHRVVVISGDVRGGPGIYVLLPDETVARVHATSGGYETCTVQEFADWHEQYATRLWDAVVWLRHSLKEMRELSRALWRSEEAKWQAIRSHIEAEGLDPRSGLLASMGPDQHEEFGEFVSKDRRRFRFEVPFSEARVSLWEEDPPDWERYPQGYSSFSHACWFLDASEGKTSDWIFKRPYDWWDKIKPGWNPPFGKPTYATAEEAALMVMNKDVVRVASTTPTQDNEVEVLLEMDDDPSGEFPMTILCEQLPNGRWRQKRRKSP